GPAGSRPRETARHVGGAREPARREPWAACSWGGRADFKRVLRPLASHATARMGGRADRRGAGVGEVENLREPAASGRDAVETAMRSLPKAAEVCCASWYEFDFDAAVWTVPAGHMKRGRAHRVPPSTGRWRCSTRRGG
ncbi:MAG: hypothetical protein OXH15_20835, partial [Gammaproteobacteria bacterium]|nr:hypothetical protein [Gammaproteobacteria bacterium]